MHWQRLCVVGCAATPSANNMSLTRAEFPETKVSLNLAVLTDILNAYMNAKWQLCARVLFLSWLSNEKRKYKIEGNF